MLAAGGDQRRAGLHAVAGLRLGDFQPGDAVQPLGVHAGEVRRHMLHNHDAGHLCRQVAQDGGGGLGPPGGGADCDHAEANPQPGRRRARPGPVHGQPELGADFAAEGREPARGAQVRQVDVGPGGLPAVGPGRAVLRGADGHRRQGAEPAQAFQKFPDARLFRKHRVRHQHVRAERPDFPLRLFGSPGPADDPDSRIPGHRLLHGSPEGEGLVHNQDFHRAWLHVQLSGSFLVN